ncbi:unnamed protein product, partial [Oppiella nova]
MDENQSEEWTYSRFYPLHAATQLGDVGTVEALILKHKLSANETDYDYLTPLHIASFAGHLSCARLLIQFGAHINARSIDGGTPLCGASASGNFECVQLLITNGAQVNPVHSLSTPLHEAAFAGTYIITTALSLSLTLTHSLSPSP